MQKKLSSLLKIKIHRRKERKEIEKQMNEATQLAYIFSPADLRKRSYPTVFQANRQSESHIHEIIRNRPRQISPEEQRDRARAGMMKLEKKPRLKKEFRKKSRAVARGSASESETDSETESESNDSDEEGKIEDNKIKGKKKRQKNGTETYQKTKPKVYSRYNNRRKPGYLATKKKKESPQDINPKTPSISFNELTTLSKPKRALNRFFIFRKEYSEKLRNENPELNIMDINNKVKEKWNSMNEIEKRPYMRKQMENQKEYEEKKQVYYKNLYVKSRINEICGNSEIKRVTDKKVRSIILEAEQQWCEFGKIRKRELVKKTEESRKKT